MAVVTCPKCEGHIFEASTNFEEIFMQCASCGCVVEVVKYHNVGDLVKDQGKQIEELSRRLSDIEDQVTHIAGKLQE